MHRRLAQGVYYETREPVITWDDIAGYSQIKEKVKQLVSLPLICKNELEEQGIQLPTGVMLWGPLGVGIKMMAEAAASEARVKLIYVSGREILGKPDELREAFKTARVDRPCVLFVSDTEWLAPQPHADYSWVSKGVLHTSETRLHCHSERSEESRFLPSVEMTTMMDKDGSRTATTRGKPMSLADRELTTIFLEELDNISGLRDIALVGSCYRIDVVDQCLFKEKLRFNRKIFVPPLSSEERMDVLKFFINKMNLGEKNKLDLEMLARKTEYYTCWDIENLCKDAVILAIRNNDKNLRQEYFTAALLRIKPWLTGEMTKKYFELYEEDCPHYYNF